LTDNTGEDENGKDQTTMGTGTGTGMETETDTEMTTTETDDLERQQDPQTCEPLLARWIAGTVQPTTRER
jgi:hypothetical protein